MSKGETEKEKRGKVIKGEIKRVLLLWATKAKSHRDPRSDWVEQLTIFPLKEEKAGVVIHQRLYFIG